MSPPVPLDLEPIKRSLPPVGFWSYPWEKTIHSLIAEIERLRRELKYAKDLYEANHG